MSRLCPLTRAVAGAGPGCPRAAAVACAGPDWATLAPGQDRRQAARGLSTCQMVRFSAAPAGAGARRKLDFADLDHAQLQGAVYDRGTRWPDSTPNAAGAILQGLAGAGRVRRSDGASGRLVPVADPIAPGKPGGREGAPDQCARPGARPHQDPHSFHACEHRPERVKDTKREEGAHRLRAPNVGERGPGARPRPARRNPWRSTESSGSAPGAATSKRP